MRNIYKISSDVRRQEHLLPTFNIGYTCMTNHIHLCEITHPRFMVYTELPGDPWLTYKQKTAKMAVTRELIDKVLIFPDVTHQNVISYSWNRTVTRAYSPPKSTSSTTVFNRWKRSWNLSISMASELFRSQVHRQLVAIHSWECLATVVNR